MFSSCNIIHSCYQTHYKCWNYIQSLVGFNLQCPLELDGPTCLFLPARTPQNKHLELCQESLKCRSLSIGIMVPCCVAFLFVNNNLARPKLEFLFLVIWYPWCVYLALMEPRGFKVKFVKKNDVSCAPLKCSFFTVKATF